MKYTIVVYEARHSYTSYNNLSLEKSSQIGVGNFSNIPEVIRTELGDINIADDQYIIDAWENPGKTWIHNKKSDWYTHVPTGIKIRQETRSSPEYHKPNGCGDSTTTLTVKIPLPDGRGKNPNSHHNKPSIEGKTRNIKLTDWEWEKLAALGEGKGFSQGIRNLIKYSSATSPE